MIDISEMTILIVDDQVSMTKSIHNMMKVIGYGETYLFANSGQEALNILQDEAVDLVMLDYNMPGMDGGEVLSIIRDHRKMRDIPVIMVTAEAYQDYVAEVGESEIDAYILKPVTIKLLEEKVSSVIDRYNNPPPMVQHLKNARGFEEEGDIESAIEQAKLAMEANPNVTRPIRELGYYYYLNNELDKAEQWLLKAAKMNRLDVFAFHHLGELYLRLNDIEKSAHYFGKAMEISPRHLERGISFGKTLVRMNMIAKAISVFEKVFQLSGSTLELKEEIAEFCLSENVNEYAAKLLESLVARLNNRADLFFKLGKVLEKLGDTKKAITYLEKSSKLDETDILTKIHLAKNYLTLGKPLMAEKPLKMILEKNPNNELAQELLRQCS